MTKKQVSDEITKSKRHLMIERGNQVFEKIIIFLDSKKLKKVDDKFFSNIINDICVYGSKEAIAIFASFQQFNYLSEEGKSKKNKFTPFAYLCLLLAQLKYDITGEVINPMEILRMRINDYETNPKIKNNVPLVLNELVDEHNLNKNSLNLTKGYP